MPPGKQTEMFDGEHGSADPSERRLARSGQRDVSRVAAIKGLVRIYEMQRSPARTHNR